MVHCAASLPIFLVVNIETDGIRGSQFIQGYAVWKDGAVFEKANVLSPKLDGASASFGSGHGIFARPKQKEKRNGE
jgi:hypothetical protein